MTLTSVKKNRSLRIVMVGSFGLHPYQTMGTRALRLAAELVQDGHHVTILMPPWQTPAEQGRVWEEQGVQIQYVSLRFGVLAQTLRMIFRIYALQPDVLHGFKPKGHAGLVLLWFWLTAKHRLRVVLDSDDWEGRGGWNDRAGYSELQKKFFSWQEKTGFRSAHAVTVASRALEREAARIRGSSEKIYYLPNGPGIVVPHTMDTPKNYDVVVYSRFFEFSIERLIETIQEIEKLRPHTSFLFLGEPLRDVDNVRLERSIKDRALEKCITRLGWIQRENIAGLIWSARCAIYLLDDTLLNSTKCPVKLVDLLSVGLPVVADRVGEAESMIRHRETGFLVEPGRSEKMASSVVELLENVVLAERIGKAARKDVQRLRWEESARTLVHCYGALT